MYARLELDEQAQAGYLRLSTTKVKRSVVVADSTLVVDLDIRGNVVGIEILNLSIRIGVELSDGKITGLVLIGHGDWLEGQQLLVAVSNHRGKLKSLSHKTTELMNEWVRATFETHRLETPFTWPSGPRVPRLHDLFTTPQYRTAAIVYTVVHFAFLVVCVWLMAQTIHGPTSYVAAVGLGVAFACFQNPATFMAVERFTGYQ